MEPLPPVVNPFVYRALAYFADLIVVYALVVISLVLCVGAYGATALHGDPEQIRALLQAPSTKACLLYAHALIYLSYFTIAHWYAGRTVGKWLWGLRVTHQGGDLSLPRAFGRSLGYLVSGQLTLCVGFLLPLFRRDGLALHDLLLRTEVVRAAEPETLAAIPAAQRDRAA